MAGVGERSPQARAEPPRTVTGKLQELPTQPRSQISRVPLPARWRGPSEPTPAAPRERATAPAAPVNSPGWPPRGGTAAGPPQGCPKATVVGGPEQLRGGAMAAGSENALSYPAKGTGNGAPQDRPQVLSSPATEPRVRGLLPSYSGAGDPEPSITLSFPWEGQPSTRTGTGVSWCPGTEGREPQWSLAQLRGDPVPGALGSTGQRSCCPMSPSLSREHRSQAELPQSSR